MADLELSDTSHPLYPHTLRQTVLHMAYAGGSVHVACAFSLIEIVSVLLGSIMNRGASARVKGKEDRLLLSKGHGVMALYAAQAAMGELDPIHLKNYFSDGSLLHGLCEAKVPGSEICSGSLGHGLPIAAGLALGFKIKAKQANSSEVEKVYCIVGDGEMNEGSMWEALLFASHQKLDNLIVIVDANGFQAMGRTQEVMNLEPFVEKFESFGWRASECDGHHMGAIESEIKLLADTADSRPQALVARTIKGKGVSFMENQNEWHYTRLNEDNLQKALKELKSV